MTLEVPALPEMFFSLKDYATLKAAFTNNLRDPSVFPDDVIEVYKHVASMPGALTAMINYYRANIGSATRGDKAKKGKISVKTLVVWVRAAWRC